MRKVKFIYNPASGESVIVDRLDEVIEAHQRYGFAVVPYRLNRNMNMEEALSDTRTGYSHILIAGGDGSVDLLINTMLKMGIDLPIGILPMGTANDYASYLNISKDVTEAITTMLTSDPRSMDLGQINDKYFVNVASSGLFTDVSQRTHTELKNSIGKLAYYIKGLEQIPNFRKIPVKLTSKHGNYEGDMLAVLVFNGRTAGSLDLAYKSKADDGLLDVILIKAVHLKELMPLLAKMLRGDHLEDPVGLLYFQTDELFLETNDHALVSDIDGERGPDFPLHIHCIKGGVRILGVRDEG